MSLDFERPILELEGKIQELLHMASNGKIDISREIQKLQEKALKTMKVIYGKLSPWQKVQVARHPERPHFLDYVKHVCDDFIEVCGDRCFGDDKSIICGFSLIKGRKIALIGHEKGHDVESRLRHNFGMPMPEGYRKAQRFMKIAEKLKIPVVSLIDTGGAYPGIEAEQRGQAEAIAKSMSVCMGLKVPLIAVIIGEGCSGGAIAIGAANRVAMLEHSVYTVISPEGCASILWKTPEAASLAAAAQKLTAQDLLKFKIIDKIIDEPIGGAHRDMQSVMTSFVSHIMSELDECYKIDDIAGHRYKKFLSITDLKIV